MTPAAARSRRLALRATLVLSLATTALLAPLSAQTTYEIRELPGPSQVFPTQMTEWGLVAGDKSTGIFETRAILWLGDRFLDLPGLGGDFSELHGLNESGVAVGRADDAAGVAGPVAWVLGRAFELPTLGGAVGTARDIDDSFRIVGNSTRPGGSAYYPFLLEPSGEIRELPGFERDEGGAAAAINRHGVIVGWTLRGFGNRAVRWNLDGTVDDLGHLGGENATAVDVNDWGEIVGSSTPEGGGLNNAFFVGTDGVMVDLEQEGSLSQAYALNAAGQVVGNESLLGGFVWQGGEWYLASDLLPPDSGWTELSSASAINDRGEIAGGGKLEDSSRGFLLVPVLSLGTPSPGRVGEVNTLIAEGAAPGAEVDLFVGERAGLTAAPDCFDRALWIDGAVPVQTAVADGEGRVRFETFVPRGVAGERVFLQALEIDGCIASNLRATSFAP